MVLIFVVEVIILTLPLERSNAAIRGLGGIGPIIDCLAPVVGSGSEDVETTRAALRTLCNLSIDGSFSACS